jgi:hypothetical protein
MAQSSYQHVPNPPYSLVQFNMIQGNLNHTSAIGDYSYNYNIVPNQAASTRKPKQPFNALNNFTQGFIDIQQLSNPASATHTNGIQLLQNASVSSYKEKNQKRSSLQTTKGFASKTRTGSFMQPSESPNYTKWGEATTDVAQF